MAKYSLIGVDGNAFAVMGYTAHALREQGLKNEVKIMFDQATRGDYRNLLMVCSDFLDKANRMAEERERWT